MKKRPTFFSIPFYTLLGKKSLQRKTLVNLRNDFLQMFVATLHNKLSILPKNLISLRIKII